MANRFWVGGTNSWNSTAGTKWALTSGGAGGQAVPTASDDVFFDSASGAVTVSVSSAGNCHSLTFTGFTGTFSGGSGIGISGSLLLVSGMTFTYTGQFTFNDTSGTVQTITSAGQTFGGIIVANGVGGSWQLADAILSTSALTVTNGTFDFNGKSAQFTALATAAGTKTIKLGSSRITLTATTTVLSISPTNLTLTTSGSKFIVNDSSSSTKAILGGAAVTYDDLQFTGSGILTITGGGPWRDVTISSTTATSFAFITNVVTCRSLDFTGFTGTWASTQATLSLTGNLTMASGMTNSNISTIIFIDTSGTTRSITSHGIILVGVTFNGVGGVWQLADAMNSSSTITLTNGSLTTAGFAVQCVIFSSTNSNTRSLDITNSTITVVPTTVTTPWNFATITGLTFTSTGSRIVFKGSSTGNIAFSAGALTYNDIEYSGSSSDNWLWIGTAPTIRDIFITNTGGGHWSPPVTWNGGRNLDFTGFNGTFGGTVAANLTGNFTLASGMTYTSTGTFNFVGTSGTQSITSHGITIPANVIFNGVGGTFQLADAFIATGSVILTNGTFDTNSQTVSAGTLSSTNSNIRTLSITNSTITLTSTGAVLTFATSTNLTINSSGSTIIINESSATSKSINIDSVTLNDIQFDGSSSGTFTVNAGSPTIRDFTVSNSGSAHITWTLTSATMRNFDCTGYTGTMSGAGLLLVSGNFLFGTGMSFTFSGSLIFNATSGVKTITSRSVNISAAAVSFNGVGGSWQLQDDFSNTGGSVVFLSNGSLDTNGKGFSVTGLQCSNSNTRGLTLGSSLVTLTGTNTVWNFTTTAGLTFSAGTSNILINDASASGKSFAGGGLTYATLTLSGVGTGIFAISQSNTFANLNCIASPNGTIQFDAGSTQTITNNVTLLGGIGNHVTLQSSSAGVQWTILKLYNIVNADFLTITDSVATGGARWFAGRNSINGGNNSGWIFAGGSDRPGTGMFPFVF